MNPKHDETDRRRRGEEFTNNTGGGLHALAGARSAGLRRAVWCRGRDVLAVAGVLLAAVMVRDGVIPGSCTSTIFAAGVDGVVTFCGLLYAEATVGVVFVVALLLVGVATVLDRVVDEVRDRREAAA